MYEKLAFLEEQFEELSKKITDPEIIADIEKWQKLMKEHASLTPIVEKYREYKKAADTVKESEEMLKTEKDPEFCELLTSEINENRDILPKLEEELKILLLPKDPNDEKNVIVEIRGGAGGDEAALFAADLFRMYSMYAESKHWKVETLSSNITDIGGIKEISFMIEGNGASTVTVAVLPEAGEVEVDINPNDLRIDVFRAGGPGGQCVNTTDSAVRITHLPTGLVVSCQDEKSQHKNKDKAMKILRSRLYDLISQQQHDAIADERRSQVGTGDRSERIRTYNFPQGRVSDHRIGLTIHKLDAFLNGDMDEVIDALITNAQSEKLKSE